MKLLKRTYKKFNVWLSVQFDKHPVITITILFLLTYSLIRENRFLESIFYIALVFFITMTYLLSKIKTDKNTKVFVIVGVIIVIFIACLYIFSGVLTYIPKQYRILKISEWVGVLSTIFGGFLTMFGVWYSIEETRKQNLNALAIQSIPLINVSIGNYLKDDPFHFGVECDMDGHHYNMEAAVCLPIRISNTSNYIARSFKFRSFSIERFYNEGFDDTEEFKLYPPFEYNFTESVNNEVKIFSAIPGGFSEAFDLWFSFKDDRMYWLDITCELEYFDYANTLRHLVKTKTSICLERNFRILKEVDHEGVEFDTPSLTYKVVRNSEVYTFVE